MRSNISRPSRPKAEKKTASKGKRAKGKCGKDGDLYSRGWDEAKELIPKVEALHTRLEDTDFPPQRARYKSKIEKLNAPLRRLTTHHYDLNRFVIRYAEQHGGKVENIAELIREAKAAGLCTKMTDAAIRIHVRRAFGIRGQPGRKPR